jgi:hypothetical protein
LTGERCLFHGHLTRICPTGVEKLFPSSGLFLWEKGGSRTHCLIADVSVAQYVRQNRKLV